VKFGRAVFELCELTVSYIVFCTKFYVYRYNIISALCTMCFSVRSTGNGAHGPMSYSGKRGSAVSSYNIRGVWGEATENSVSGASLE